MDIDCALSLPSARRTHASNIIYLPLEHVSQLIASGTTEDD